ncbi:MAG: hypothetical protein P8Y45_02220 [Exilibacterium sp.]
MELQGAFFKKSLSGAIGEARSKMDAYDFISWLGKGRHKDYWEFIFSKCKDPGCGVKYEDFVDETLLNILQGWAKKSMQPIAGTAAD